MALSIDWNHVEGSEGRISSAEIPRIKTSRSVESVVKKILKTEAKNEQFVCFVMEKKEFIFIQDSEK